MSPRLLFEEELEELKRSVSDMGEQIEKVYDRLFEVLKERDREALEAIVTNDRVINDMQRSIEAKCLTLLTKQQPVARDLSTVSAALKVVTDIERVGDHVSDMAELFLRLDMQNVEDFSASLPQMIKAAKRSVGEAIEAFVDMNMEAAKDVIAFDDVIDDLFN